MNILAVDPGPEESAYVTWDGEKIHGFGKIKNEYLLSKEFKMSFGTNTILVIEKVCCYGMPVGESVFETVFFTGMLAQSWHDYIVKRIPRKEVKLHICGNVRARDSNIIQELKNRFGEKGTKKEKGFFYGFSKDVWQAFALAVTFLENNINY